MVKKVLSLLIFSPLVWGALYGVHVGSSTSDSATAFNNGPHVVHYANTPWDDIVYHTVENGRFIGRYVRYNIGTYETIERLIGEGNENVAYPSIAIDEVWYTCVPIVYLTGDYLSGLLPPTGPLRLAIYYPEWDEWDYEDIDPRLMDGGVCTVAGPPSITYGFYWQGAWGSERKLVFFITFAAYESSTNLTRANVQLWILVVRTPPGERPYIQLLAPFVLLLSSSYPDAVNVHRPSTAVYDYGVHSDMGDPEEEDYVYLHSVWSYEDGNRNIGYGVTYWDRPRPWNIDEREYFGWRELEQKWQGNHYNPQVAIYGERLWLNWSYEDSPGDEKEIYRRIRHSWAFGDRRYFHESGWEPPLCHDKNKYVPPHNMSTWGWHNSENLHSEWPQADAHCTLWMEEDPSPDYEYEIWFDAWDPEWPEEERLIDAASNIKTMNNLYPHIDTRITYEGDDIFVSHSFVWTRKLDEDNNPIEDIWGGYLIRPSELQTLQSLRNSERHIEIGPYVPIYYNIKCGEPKPSQYCERRDGYGTFNGHKVDIGSKELIYRLPLLKPPYYYLVRAIASAPQFIPDSGSITQSFNFDGEEVYMSIPSLKPETLDFILPPHLYEKDHRIKLRIKGSKGAYLERLLVYQFEIMGSKVQSHPFGITSGSSLSPLELTILPSLFQSLTIIQYQVPCKGEVSVEVYDATGRLVRALLEAQSREPGTYTLSWDGRDENGKRLPGGVYFVKLKASNHTLTRKIVIMR